MTGPEEKYKEPSMNEDDLDALNMLLPTEQVEECVALQEELASKGIKRGLCEIALTKGYVSIDRLQEIGKYFAGNPKKSEEEGGVPDVPGYRIIGEVGAGRMGVVYKAKQVAMDRDVALKVMSRQIMSQPGAIDRFLTEARAVAKLNHPNIVQAYNCGKAGQDYFLVMEYVDGQPLNRLLEKSEFLKEERALDFAVQICRGLYHAHMHKIIHCDLKPGNVLVARLDQVKLADFGLARVAAGDDGGSRGPTIGSPAYMSPEQARGERNIDKRSDIYSFGICLYEMLTGLLPFSGTSAEIMSKHNLEPCPDVRHDREDISEATALVIKRCTQKAPEERYQDTLDLLKALQRSQSELQSADGEELETVLLQRLEGVIRPAKPDETDAPDLLPVTELPPPGTDVRMTPDQILEEMEATKRKRVPEYSKTKDVFVKYEVLGGTPKGEKGDLKAGQRLTIGREASICNLVIKEPTVSRLHCVITYDGSILRLEDAGSRNGTFINGKPARSSVINLPAVVIVGATQIRFELSRGAWMKPQDGK
ncbi:MAG TPA: FHA domain-containing serine/threonine-protein kinase [Candidatus Brocadiia bacterium]|nr:FHA domain-containing serine/threonine-protein kinase [Candidatus Brocadiia bacterium]